MTTNPNKAHCRVPDCTTEPKANTPIAAPTAVQNLAPAPQPSDPEETRPPYSDPSPQIAKNNHRKNNYRCNRQQRVCSPTLLQPPVRSF